MINPIEYIIEKLLDHISDKYKGKKSLHIIEIEDQKVRDELEQHLSNFIYEKMDSFLSREYQFGSQKVSDLFILNKEQVDNILKRFYELNPQLKPHKFNIDKYLQNAIFQINNSIQKQLDIGEKILYGQTNDLALLILRQFDDLKSYISIESLHLEYQSNDNLGEFDKNNLLKINQSFIDKMNDALFLSDNVSLKNLYVPPNYSGNLYLRFKINDSGDIVGLLYNFVQNRFRKISVMFIEGSPGAGKTSLLSYLSYKYSIGEINFPRIICIRLISVVNSLGKKAFLDNPPLESILQYMSLLLGQKVSINTITGSILFLDGIDEICAVESLNINDFCRSLVNSTLLNEQILFHLVITTRIGYIRETFNNSIVITLESFSMELIEKFAENYFQYHNLNKYDNVINKNLDFLRNNISYQKIYGIPLLLYLTFSFRILLKDVNSIGDFYDKIFLELEQRNYDERINQSEQIHPVTNIISSKEARYIAQSLAYEMFQKDILLLPINNGNLVFPVLNKTNKENFEKLIPITFYYKTNKDVVEFVHKTMQEFFVAEKIVNDLFIVNNDNFANYKSKVYMHLGQKKYHKKFMIL